MLSCNIELFFIVVFGVILLPPRLPHLLLTIISNFFSLIVESALVVLPHKVAGHCRIGIGGNGGCKHGVIAMTGLVALLDLYSRAITVYLCSAIAMVGRPCSTFEVLLYLWQTGTQYQNLLDCQQSEDTVIFC